MTNPNCVMDKCECLGSVALVEYILFHAMKKVFIIFGQTYFWYKMKHLNYTYIELNDFSFVYLPTYTISIIINQTITTPLTTTTKESLKNSLRITL